MLGAGAVLAVLAVATGEIRRVHLASAGASLAALAYLIVLGSVLAYSTYEWLVHNAPARLVGTYAFVNPVVAVGLGWWLLGEDISVRTALAAAIIAAGVALIVTQRRRRARGTPWCSVPRPAARRRTATGSRPGRIRARCAPCRSAAAGRSGSPCR
jgi:drug/metabolite transporter (DMT)-like permease